MPQLPLRRSGLLGLALLFSACGVSSDHRLTPGEFASSEEALSPVTGVTCPGASAGVCSYNPAAMPAQLIYPGVFTLQGPNPADPAGTRQGNELAFSFQASGTGYAGTLNMILRRVSNATNPAAHDLLVDVLQVPGSGIVPVPAAQPPPNCGEGAYSYVARARFDTSTLAFGVDNNVAINFVSTATQLQATQTYALFLHIETPGIDRLGVAGSQSKTFTTGSTLLRQSRVTGPSCLSNPAWTTRADSDANFALTIPTMPVCSAGGVSTCGTGICTRTGTGCDPYGVPSACIPNSCATNADCCPTLSAAALATGVTLNCANYTCNSATHLCASQAETCNGLDDNCSGSTDEGLVTGAGILTCTDVNRCATGNGGCAAGATCTNTYGSVICSPVGSPGAPTGLMAAAGDAQATLSWTAPTSTGTSALNGYTITATPGGVVAATLGATSVVVKGLVNGTSYTFTVHATNLQGSGPESAGAGPITPMGAAGMGGTTTLAPHAGQALVSGGAFMTSAHYQLITTMGQGAGDHNTLSSSHFVLVGGVAGASEAQ